MCIYYSGNSQESVNTLHRTHVILRRHVGRLSPNRDLWFVVAQVILRACGYHICAIFRLAIYLLSFEFFCFSQQTFCCIDCTICLSRSTFRKHRLEIWCNDFAMTYRQLWKSVIKMHTKLVNASLEPLVGGERRVSHYIVAYINSYTDAAVCAECVFVHVYITSIYTYIQIVLHIRIHIHIHSFFVASRGSFIAVLHEDGSIILEDLLLLLHRGFFLCCNEKATTKE